jgi:hypothetical protein
MKETGVGFERRCALSVHALPNHGVQATAYSVRGAPAFSRA